MSGAVCTLSRPPSHGGDYLLMVRRPGQPVLRLRLRSLAAAMRELRKIYLRAVDTSSIYC